MKAKKKTQQKRLHQMLAGSAYWYAEEYGACFPQEVGKKPLNAQTTVFEIYLN